MNVLEPLEPALSLRAVASTCRTLLRTALLPAALALACCTLSGCASFMDDVTSRDFKMRSLWEKPDPILVLSESTDGDKRATALRMLHEPAQYGESKEKQDQCVVLLCTAVQSERTALARQAAIASLRTFKDPRVSEALLQAYYKAADYPPDTATILRCQTLEALGQVGNPNAIDLLTRVVKEPPVEGTEQDRQQKLQERMAAARALGHFKRDEAAETLLTILKTETDPALREGATASLQLETGKRFAADAQVWDHYLHSSKDKKAIYGEPSFSDKVLDVVNVSWWK